MAAAGKYSKVTATNIAEDDVQSARIVALDVGTTYIRAHVYDRGTRIVGEASRKIELLTPKPGWVEMDEGVLWRQTQDVIGEALGGAGMTAADVTAMGITTQRNTFITWDADTGVPFHHFITWQDLRAAELVRTWNKSYTLRAMNSGAHVLYLVTRLPRFLAASVLRFKSAQTVMRIKWVLENNEAVRARLPDKKVMYGTIETWLLWKLTGGKTWATEYSHCSSSAVFDPFQMEWSSIVSGLLNIPLHIFPPILDTSTHFGDVEPAIFGAAFPVTSMIADQQSAMFGQCCFSVGDVKCTMGTGTFIDCNTGGRPHASIAGLYPLIGWKIGADVTFLAEGQASDTGRCLEWAKSVGLYADIGDTSDICESVADTDGVHFISAFNGLQAPVNDDRACATFFGLKLSTTPAHMVRAIVESLGYRFQLLYEAVLGETKTRLTPLIRCDGGVCKSDFLMQLIADVTDRELDRPEHMEMTSLGAAFLAGLAVGVWREKEELVAIRRTQKLFKPSARRAELCKPVYAEWCKALKRSKDWYKVVDV